MSNEETKCGEYVSIKLSSDKICLVDAADIEKITKAKIDKLEALADQVDAMLSMAKRIRGKAVDDGDYWEISDDTFQEVQKAFDTVKS